MLIKLFLLFHTQVAIPVPQVEVVSSEIEAVWVPEGLTGPIVAIPLSENCFQGE
jgi:chemotaxis protein CheY-P-specific phosphatase CheC